MKKKVNRPWAVFVAIVLAVLFGSWAGQDKALFGINLYSILDTFGELFLKSLMLIVVPLVSSSIITGISRIGNEQSFGRLGLKMFLLYFGTTIVAILIGIFFFNLFSPGSSQPNLPLSPDQGEQIASLRQATGEGIGKLVKVLLDIVPPNVIVAFSPGHMLGLIFFSILFGFALSRVSSTTGTTVQNFCKGIFQTMIEVTHLIMKLLPLGVFFLVGKVFAKTGFDSLGPLVLFLFTVVLGLVVFMFLVLPLALRVIGKVNPLHHFKAMTPSLVTAFSTSSTSATLPVTLDCVEKRAGVSNKITGLVLPLATSFNMSGSALYACVTTLFIAQAYGMDLSFETQLLIFVASFITSVGIAGVPSGSLVSVMVVMSIVGIPPEGIGLFIAADRLIDMVRTTVNVFSNSCCTVLVARLEGEKVLQQT